MAGIGAVASLLLYAVWPRETRECRRSAPRRGSRGARQCRLGRDRRGRRGAGLQRCLSPHGRREGRRSAPPPELALAARRRLPCSIACRVLPPKAKRAKKRLQSARASRLPPRCVRCATGRPPGGSRRAWRASGAKSAVPCRTTPAPQLASRACPFFRDAPMGVALADAERQDCSKPMPSFAQFFGAGVAGGRAFCDLVEDARPRGRRATSIAARRRRQRQPTPSNLRPLASPTAWPNFRQPVTARSERAVLYLVDVSEQKALETKFAQSQKMQAVGQLAGGVAHDFNNLLTVIIGNCEFLLMRHQAGDPSFKEINEIHQNALRAATLVGQLLAFSRKQTMQPKRAGAARCGRRTGADAAPAAARRHRAEARARPPISGPSMPTRRRFPTPSSIWWSMRATPCRRAAAVTIAHRQRNAWRRRPRWAPPSCRRAIMCASKCADTGIGISQGTSGQDLRSLLHHQAGGAGHGPGPRHRLRHRQADRRLHHRRQRSGQGHGASTSICRAISGEPARSPSKPSAPRRATSPARTPSCWSKTKKRCAASPRARCACAAIMCWKPPAAKKRWRSSSTPARSICSSPTW